MIKILKFLFVIILLLLIVQKPAFGQAKYVLPYPSFMPGTIFHKLYSGYEEISKIWSFGNISRFKNDLKFSDKYLVEAKILFDYNQYFLATAALERSDKYFENTKTIKSKIDSKNVQFDTSILFEAEKKHIEELEKLKKDLPEEFTWQEKNKEPIKLNLKKIIEKSIAIREE